MYTDNVQAATSHNTQMTQDSYKREADDAESLRSSKASKNTAGSDLSAIAGLSGQKAPPAMAENDVDKAPIDETAKLTSLMHREAVLQRTFVAAVLLVELRSSSKNFDGTFLVGCGMGCYGSSAGKEVRDLVKKLIWDGHDEFLPNLVPSVRTAVERLLAGKAQSKHEFTKADAMALVSEAIGILSLTDEDKADVIREHLALADLGRAPWYSGADESRGIEGLDTFGSRTCPTGTTNVRRGLRSSSSHRQMYLGLARRRALHHATGPELKGILNGYARRMQ